MPEPTDDFMVASMRVCVQSLRLESATPGRCAEHSNNAKPCTFDVYHSERALRSGLINLKENDHA